MSLFSQFGNSKIPIHVEKLRSYAEWSEKDPPTPTLVWIPVKSELNDVADPASRNKLQTMRENAKSHGWKIEAELNRLALVQLIPYFEMLLARLIALTDAMHDPARSQDKFD